MGRLLLAGALLLLAVPGPAGAACTAPGLTVVGAPPSPRPGLGGEPVPVVRVAPGQAVEVLGAAPYVCDDTGTYGTGCGQPRPPAPADDVALLLVQGDRRTVLDVADARDDYLVRWRAVLPDDLAEGPAVLLQGGVGLDLEVVR